MAHTGSNRRLTFLLAIGLVAGGGLATADSAHAQSARFRVLIPNLEPQEGSRDRFGRDVAEEMKKLINSTPTHQPVERNDVRDALRRYNIREQDLNCITARQLAMQMGVELVLCGQYTEAGAGAKLEASFVSRDGQTFEVSSFDAANPRAAAQHVFDSFQNYTRQLGLIQYCMEDLGNEQWDGALEKCSESLQINDRSETANYGRGYSLMKLERFDQALVALRVVLDINPLNEDALLAGGFVAAKLEQPQVSRDFYRQYLELNPGNTQVRLTVATEAANAGDPAGALQIAEEGLQTSPDDVSLAEYAGYFASAAAGRLNDPTRAAGDPRPAEQVALLQKAVVFYDQVIAAKGPEAGVAIHENKISALTQLGRTQEAVDAGAKAVADQPGEAKLWYQYSAALKEAGQVAEAVAALDSVAARDPNFPNVISRQAIWLLETGDLDRAKTSFRTAVDKGELESDNAAQAIFGNGYTNRFQRGQQMETIPFFDAARDFATTPRTRGMINFFHAFALYNRGMRVQEPSTPASAREALAIFQRARDLLQQAGGYTEGAGNIQQVMAATQQYIEIQEALLRRGSGGR